MKNLRKWTALAAVMAMTATLFTGCGSADAPASEATAPAAESTAAATTETGAEAPAADGELAADVQAIVDRGVLRVGVKNAVVGFGFQDTLTGEYSGLEISLAEKIAESLGVDVEFTAVTAATRTELLDSGDIDCVLATFTITDERKQSWDFSTPYFTDYVTVLVEDKSGITSLADLVDKKVGVSSGSTSAKALTKAMIEAGLIDGSGFFKSSAPEELVNYIPEIPESTCMVFVESEVDKRNKLYKKVKDNGYAAELKKQDADQLMRWAAGILSKDGKKITRQVMEYFMERTGDDMENIRMELEKLICYTMGREVITKEDVEAVGTVHVTNRIFEMVTAIVAGNTRKAMDLYEDLLTLKEPPMRIMFLIAKQFNQLLQVKELAGKGAQKSEIASRVKVPPFVAGKLMAQARAFTREQILSYVEFCVESEEAVKTGRLSDRLAVELLIAKKYE